MAQTKAEVIASRAQISKLLQNARNDIEVMEEQLAERDQFVTHLLDEKEALRLKYEDSEHKRESLRQMFQDSQERAYKAEERSNEQSQEVSRLRFAIKLNTGAVITQVKNAMSATLNPMEGLEP